MTNPTQPTDVTALARECALEVAITCDKYSERDGCRIVDRLASIIAAAFRPVVEERDVSQRAYALHKQQADFFCTEATRLAQENDRLRVEVERLKAENKGLRDGKPIGAVVGAMTILEQDRTINELRAEMERLKEGIAQSAKVFGERAQIHEAIIQGRAIKLQPFREEISHLRAALEQAEGALKPLGNLVNWAEIAPDDPDEDEFLTGTRNAVEGICGVRTTVLTVGDLRRANQALARIAEARDRR